MSPNPSLLNDLPKKKMPARRNISETSLDFSLLNSSKKFQPFDLVFEAGVSGMISDMPDGLSNINKHELNDIDDVLPYGGIVGEKRLKLTTAPLEQQHDIIPALYFDVDNERVDLLSIDEGITPSASKRQRLV